MSKTCLNCLLYPPALRALRSLGHYVPFMRQVSYVPHVLLKGEQK